MGFLNLTPIFAALVLFFCSQSYSEIASTHVYHNHMPNFWPYYDVEDYSKAPVGSPIRYLYDGDVVKVKKNPPSDWFFLPDGKPMPHDALVEGGGYYSHHAKWGAYLYWPWQLTDEMNRSFPLSQNHVTMSAAVVNNVQSLNILDIPELGGKYNNPNWGSPWRNTYDQTRTPNGHRALDLIHFTGHHTLGPLVGKEYFLKDLIYHNTTLAQPYFLGESFRSSKGFFPTELGFSERLIPELVKLGIEWSVIGNVHFSRTLTDYPYLNDPGADTLVSPPNRADIQNRSDVGSWVSQKMFNEQQITRNKFPFASIPHNVQYIDPETAKEYTIAGVPVEQAGSWEEGYLGEVKADVLKDFEGVASGLGRTQYFVLAHDGDNSSGRAGSEETWRNGFRVTYGDHGVSGVGVDEYLQRYPIPENDIVHVQDGSWIDTRDSSADPSWYHWHLPFGIWNGQLSLFNDLNGSNYEQRYAWNGKMVSHMVSLEYGYNYLERNYALLQVALNYAKTSEQVWLDDHPNYWQPTTILDNEVTYKGNQLNPWMLSYPVKGDEQRDYQGGANPAELAWYFLLPSIDSGFGYYDENIDDHVKPTISFNQSLYFSKKYMNSRKSKDRTGPSIWWPQRYPYNPGSVNCGKAEGWAPMYMNQEFAIYTYAYDLNDIDNIVVNIRVHKNKRANPLDKTYQVYDPSKFPHDNRIDPSRVSEWKSYPMKRRDLTPQINSVAWQPGISKVMKIVPAEEIADLYYTYFDGYRDQLIDYYIEAKDKLGNISKSDIQQVYVGAGRYKKSDDGKHIENIAGDIEGQRPFFTDKPPMVEVSLYIEPSEHSTEEIFFQTRTNSSESWTEQKSLRKMENGYYKVSLAYEKGGDGVYFRYFEGHSQSKPRERGVLITEGVWNLDNSGTLSLGLPVGMNNISHVYYRSSYGDKTRIHYRAKGGEWTKVPGVLMKKSSINGFYEAIINLGSSEELEAVFTNGEGSWDNNRGRNYIFPMGSSTLVDGTVKKGMP